MAKKRPPIKKLLEAGKVAREMLEKKGIILPAEKSIIDQINQEGKLVLPGEGGSANYLPAPWTINKSRIIMRDLAREWQFNTKEDLDLQENIVEFFRFVRKVLDEEVEKFEKLQKDQAKRVKKIVKSNEPVIVADVMGPVQWLETMTRIRRFIIDSIAVSVVVKQNDSTSTFFEWFIFNWTEELLNRWDAHLRSHGKEPYTIVRQSEKVAESPTLYSDLKKLTKGAIVYVKKNWKTRTKIST
jgi:hypothetical protein